MQLCINWKAAGAGGLTGRGDPADSGCLAVGKRGRPLEALALKRDKLLTELADPGLGFFSRNGLQLKVRQIGISIAYMGAKTNARAIIEISM